MKYLIIEYNAINEAEVEGKKLRLKLTTGENVLISKDSVDNKNYNNLKKIYALKKYMNEENLSTYQVAKMAGVSYSLISKLFNPPRLSSSLESKILKELPKAFDK